MDRARAFVAEALGTSCLGAGCLLKSPDVRRCGNGGHGDGERRVTVLYRLGDVSSRRPIHLMWFKQGAPLCAPISVPLGHGDFFIPSSKAVGTDWKVRNQPTLRHATGFLNQGPAPNAPKKRKASGT